MSIGTNNLNFNFIGDDIKGDNDGDGDGMLDDIFDEFLFSSDNGISSLPQTNKKGTISEITNGDSDEDDEDDDDDEVDSEWKKRKRQRGLHKNMSEEQKN